MTTPDKIEQALDRAIERTNPGPPPSGAVWGGFIFGVLVGAAVVFWWQHRPVRYTFHLIEPGVLVRSDATTGDAAFAFIRAQTTWNAIGTNP